MAELHIDDIKALARAAHADPHLRASLFANTCGSDHKAAVHSAWALTHLPAADLPHIATHRQALATVATTTPNVSLRRLTLALLERLDWTTTGDDVPEYYIALLDFSLEHMMSPAEPYGVRSLCIKLAFKISAPYRELLAELRQHLLMIEPAELSAGVRHARNKILKAIDTAYQ